LSGFGGENWICIALVGGRRGGSGGGGDDDNSRCDFFVIIAPTATMQREKERAGCRSTILSPHHHHHYHNGMVSLLRVSCLLPSKTTNYLLSRLEDHHHTPVWSTFVQQEQHLLHKSSAPSTFLSAQQPITRSGMECLLPGKQWRRRKATYSPRPRHTNAPCVFAT